MMSVREKLLLVVLVAGGHLLMSGCTQQTGHASTGANARWSWEPYKPTERMRMAVLPCRVLPKAGLTISAPGSGSLRLYVDKAQTNLPAGFLWAELEPKILATEASALAEARARLAERERTLLDVELPKQKIGLQRQIEEAHRQLRLMELFATNRNISSSAMNMAGLREQSLKPEALQRAREEFRILQESYERLCATNATILGVDLQTLKLELQKRELEFERQRAQAQMKMPFGGDLYVTLQLAQDVTDYPVHSGQELAVVRDLSTMFVRVALSDPAWSSLPQERVSVALHLPDGTKLSAQFAYKRIEKAQFREDVVYYFQFPTEQSAGAARLVGTDLSCEIWYALPEPARIVPKLSLVMHKPEAFSQQTWAEAIQEFSSGAKLLVEGQTDVAIALSGDKPSL